MLNIIIMLIINLAQFILLMIYFRLLINRKHSVKQIKIRKLIIYILCNLQIVQIVYAIIMEESILIYILNLVVLAIYFLRDFHKLEELKKNQEESNSNIIKQSKK